MTRERFESEQPAVMCSVLSADAVARYAASHYGLAGPLSCELFHRGIQDTYRLRSAERTFAFRVYRSLDRSRAHVHGELAALRHLAARGGPVAPALPTVDGEPTCEMTAPEGIRQAVLFEWAAGAFPQYSNARHAALYGAAAARFHEAAVDFDASCMDARPRIDGDYLLERPLTLLRPFLKDHPDAARYFDGLAQRLRPCLVRLASKGLEWGLCHGDMHCGNAHVDGDRVILFDMDFCAMGWRVFDLATFRWAARLRRKEADAWQPFLEGYRSERFLSDADLEAIPMFVMLRGLWLMGHVHVTYAPSDGIAFLGLEYFEQAMAFFRGLEPEVFGADSGT